MGFLIDAVAHRDLPDVGSHNDAAHTDASNLAEILSSIPANNAVFMQGCR
jgi:hypothetical protein